jgi:hypothetical protein
MTSKLKTAEPFESATDASSFLAENASMPETSSFQYMGSELELFALASHWKSYVQSKLRPYLVGDILEGGQALAEQRGRSTTELRGDGFAWSLTPRLRKRSAVCLSYEIVKYVSECFPISKLRKNSM